METIKDLQDDLNNNIDIKHIHQRTELHFERKKNTLIKDIKTYLKKTLTIQSTQHVKLKKNTTHNFDSLIKTNKLKDINTIQNQKITKPYFISKKFLKKTTLYGILLILLLLGNGLTVKKYINSAYQELIFLKQNITNHQKATQNLEKSKFYFTISSLLAPPLYAIPSHNIKNMYHILKGGKKLILSLEQLLFLYQQITQEINQKGIENIYFTQLLFSLQPYLYEIAYTLNDTLYHYHQIDKIQNTNLNQTFRQSKNILQNYLKNLTIINRNFQTFLEILGHNQQKNYLILLQNNDEIRPTGGFIGSLGVVSIYKGKIEQMNIEDVYAYEWKLGKNYKNKIPAPKGINKIAKNLWLRDANYKIDFNESSKQIQYFTDQINLKLDGVIYLNQSIILDLLKITGELSMDIAFNNKTIKQKISADNFSQVISTIVEGKTVKLGVLGSPKKILFDFKNILISEIKKQKKYPQYIKALLKNIDSRDIVITSFIPIENSLLWKLGFNGNINFSQTLDYSYPVFTSVGGGKTDRYYQRTYHKHINANPDCSIDTTLEIHGYHAFTKENEIEINELIKKYSITNKDIPFIQGKGDNKAYLQILLPKQALVAPSPHYHIQKSQNHTIVELYINTRRGEKVKHSIQYTLPNDSCRQYEYILYKQPGIQSYNIKGTKDGEHFEAYGITQDYHYNPKK